jgi:hypothetical protein
LAVVLREPEDQVFAAVALFLHQVEGAGVGGSDFTALAQNQPEQRIGVALGRKRDANFVEGLEIRYGPPQFPACAEVLFLRAEILKRLLNGFGQSQARHVARKNSEDARPQLGRRVRLTIQQADDSPGVGLGRRSFQASHVALGSIGHHNRGQFPHRRLIRLARYRNEAVVLAQLAQADAGGKRVEVVDIRGHRGSRFQGLVGFNRLFLVAKRESLPRACEDSKGCPPCFF